MYVTLNDDGTLFYPSLYTNFASYLKHSLLAFNMLSMYIKSLLHISSVGLKVRWIDIVYDAPRVRYYCANPIFIVL